MLYRNLTLYTPLYVATTSPSRTYNGIHLSICNRYDDRVQPLYPLLALSVKVYVTAMREGIAMTDYIATYTVKQASQSVDISVSTIRKYSLILESLGYRISRDQQNARIFYDKDIHAFRQMRDGTSSGKTLDFVAQEITAANKETEEIKGNPPAPNDAQEIRELRLMIEKLVDKVDGMEQAMENAERTFRMGTSKIEMLELENEELKEKEKEKEVKKGFFARLFK